MNTHFLNETELIANAPEMLQALQEIVAEWSCDGYMASTFPNLADTFGIGLARTVLAKIERKGEEARP